MGSQYGGAKGPLEYMGVRAKNPPNLFCYAFDPESTDIKRIGALWLNLATYDLFILASIESRVANWKLILGQEDVLSFATDSGTASVVSNNINTLGDSTNISTTATGDTGTISISNGDDGELFIGGGSDPAWNPPTSAGGSVSIGRGINNLNLEIYATGTIAQIEGDSGVATPVGSEITIAGGDNITTSATGDTVTIDLNNNISIPGSLTVSSLGAGVVYGNVSGLTAALSGSDGQVLIGGGSDSQWQNITSTDGSFIITNEPNSIDIRVA